MSIEIERGEKPKGLTHRELVVQFIQFDWTLGGVLFGISEMASKRESLRALLVGHFAERIWKEEPNPVDPFADFRARVDYTIAEEVKEQITKERKSRSVPGYRVYDTGMFGLYLLEEFPNQVERNVFLVGSAERNKRFPKEQ